MNLVTSLSLAEHQIGVVNAEAEQLELRAAELHDAAVKRRQKAKGLHRLASRLRGLISVIDVTPAELLASVDILNPPLESAPFAGEAAPIDLPAVETTTKIVHRHIDIQQPLPASAAEKRKPGRPKAASAVDAPTPPPSLPKPAPRPTEAALDAKVLDIMQRAAASGGGQALFQLETLAARMQVPLLALDKSFTRLAEAKQIVQRACELKGHASFEVIAETEAAE